VPQELGGLGLESPHDLMVGVSRLGRGRASTAIAFNMHISGALAITGCGGETSSSAAIGG
jgi:hypothetical protein